MLVTLSACCVFDALREGGRGFVVVKNWEFLCSKVIANMAIIGKQISVD